MSDDRAAWISAKADNTIDPPRADAALTAISAAWATSLLTTNSGTESEIVAPDFHTALEQLGENKAHLLHLLAISPASAEKLVRDPAALLWLANDEVIRGERTLRKIRAALEREKTADAEKMIVSGFDSRFRALRKIKARESLLIALRDVGARAPLEQTTRELTALAELCVQEVANRHLEELTQRLGKPATDFAILGMGKFGGIELNYSSDIDMIFLYGDEGEINSRLTNHQFFTRLAEKIIATFTAHDAAGTLFRIDLRLRPEGNSGPLVRSLESMENYYAAFGETWERMALIKARGVGGSEELAYEASQRLQPFIYPRTISHDVLDEVAAIKARIERKIVKRDALHRNVKLGHGGIREIEFIAQSLQLIHGARHAFLQERSTLKVLQNLQQLDFIPREDSAALDAAYRFLRIVEHRLQIEAEAQTHTIPANDEAVHKLALSLGFANRDLFQNELTRHTDAVRKIFDRVFRSREESAPIEKNLSAFRDAANAEKILHELAHGTSDTHVSLRATRTFAKLEPLLLDWMPRIADADATLARFTRFVERYGSRALLYELLITNPKLLELLMRLFDASQFLTDIVLRRPQLIEELARTGMLGEPFAISDYLNGLARNDEQLAWMDWARAYRRSQILRIALRDLLGFATLEQVQAEYSALAEACTLFTQRALGFENSLTIIAMGKFGGRELSYGCDLDVIFIGDDPRAPQHAAQLIKAMSEITHEGIIFPVDPRLRPEGEAGLLALPLAAYERYFENGRAQIWEAQSLTKARPISGPQQTEFLAVAQSIWRKFSARAETAEAIRAMHERVVAERSGGDDLLNFKTGRGGLMQLEFFTQAAQMRHGIWEPNTLTAIDALAANGHLAADARERLHDAYHFLRRLEATLRRAANDSISAIPHDEFDQLHLARRLGFANRDLFFERYQAARDTISADAKL